MRRLLALIALPVALVAAVAWYVLAAAEPTPWGEPVVDGDVVRATYVGSECQTYDRVEVEESADRVVITVHETVLARSCSEVGVPYDVRVELDDPVGDRELVDGACLVAELAGYPACADGPMRGTEE